MPSWGIVSCARASAGAAAIPPASNCRRFSFRPISIEILTHQKDVQEITGLSESETMNVATQVEIDGQYRAMKEEAGVLDRPQRAKFKVRGADAAEYLQGQLTNDIEALEPDTGCYAALLDRKGHMQADMRVLRLSTGDIWLDTEAEAAPAVERHLRMYSVGREVEIEDVSAEWSILSVIGPGSVEAAGTSPLAPEHAQRFYERDGV